MRRCRVAEDDRVAAIDKSSVAGEQTRATTSAGAWPPHVDRQRAVGSGHVDADVTDHQQRSARRIDYSQGRINR